jgi:hypothetical protein
MYGSYTLGCSCCATTGRSKSGTRKEPQGRVLSLDVNLLPVVGICMYINMYIYGNGYNQILIPPSRCRFALHSGSFQCWHRSDARGAKEIPLPGYETNRTDGVFSMFMTSVAYSRRRIPAMQAENGDYRHIIAAAGCLEM